MPGSGEPVGLPGSYPSAGRLTIARDVVERLGELGAAALPNEACGVLAGPAGAADGAPTVTAAHELTNTAASPVRYETDPLEQLDAYSAIADAGHVPVGVYHSHPETPARPSVSDIAEAYDPEAVYAIVSFASENPDVRAFRIVEGSVAEFDIIVSESRP